MSSADLLQTLRTWGRLPAADLLLRLGVSRPTLMRAVRAASADLVVRGAARRSTYAALRMLRGSTAALPVYRIDETGASHVHGSIYLTYPDGSVLVTDEPSQWPLIDAQMRDGWFDGLPYPLLDMRPQGFLGRNFARAYAAILQVDENPERWSDDDTVHALSLLGLDMPGDLILGDAAYRRWQTVAHSSPPPISDKALAKRYLQLADEALQQGVGDSSAGGEFPKFTAQRIAPGASSDAQARVQNVIVKFSGADSSPGAQRWADLLVCEHLASRVLVRHLNVQAATSSIQRAGGRTFLEVVRFDRHGQHGRSGMLSLTVINGALVGADPGPWPITAAKLTAMGLLDHAGLETISKLWHFGRLTGNTDMHEGNLSFLPPAKGTATLRVAPAYDMLPMLYAPSRGMELVAKVHAPALPLPGERAAWQEAAEAASAFWKLAAADRRISTAFRTICSHNEAALRALVGHPAAGAGTRHAVDR